MKCQMCGKPLVAIGYARANGQNHSDWRTRKYHKKCFKDLEPCEIYYDIPYESKDFAKDLGAKFNSSVKSWYAPNTTVATLLEFNKFERKFI